MSKKIVLCAALGTAVLGAYIYIHNKHADHPSNLDFSSTIKNNTCQNHSQKNVDHQEDDLDNENDEEDDLDNEDDEEDDLNDENDDGEDLSGNSDDEKDPDKEDNENFILF